MSAHLTLMAYDGRVLTYPESVTVSGRALAAVKAPMLRRRERMALFVQRRLHSAFVRRLGDALAKIGLPATGASRPSWNRRSRNGTTAGPNALAPRRV